MKTLHFLSFLHAHLFHSSICISIQIVVTIYATIVFVATFKWVLVFFNKIRKIARIFSKIHSYLNGLQKNSRIFEIILCPTDVHGTSALCGRAKYAADSLDMKISLDQENNACVTANNQNISNPKEVASTLLHASMEKYFNDLTQLPLHGHSFVNMKGNRNSNSFIGNYSHNINDKIVSFAIAARTNELATGNILAKKPNHDASKDKGCPYCHTKGANDTLAHRLNGCKDGRNQQTIRHNMIEKEILDVCRKKFRRARITVDRAIHVNTNELAIRVNDRTYRPDIFIEDAKKCHIIEITVPYDGMTSNSNNNQNNNDTRNITIMEDRYKGKMRKYEDLRLKAEHLFGKKCSLTTVVVSSLGVLYEQSMRDIQKIISFSRIEKNIFERRLSIAAIIGSYFTFYNIKSNKKNTNNSNNNNNELEEEFAITDDVAGDPIREEP
jgi:hypothetical protein